MIHTPPATASVPGDPIAMPPTKELADIKPTTLKEEVRICMTNINRFTQSNVIVRDQHSEKGAYFPVDMVWIWKTPV